MHVNSLYWMTYSIDISIKTFQYGLKVGAVLVSQHNEFICSAYAGEDNNASWLSVILNKVRKLNITNAHSIYITINTMSTDCSFDLIGLLMEVNINEIYVGLPDPTLICYLDDDPILTHKCVYRYPDELLRRILELNSPFFADSRQCIKYCHYYFANRISDIVIERLESKGLGISKDELNSHKHRTALAGFICNKHGIEYSEAIVTVYNAISEAFNSKYAEYNYSDDVRSLDLGWRKNFMNFYKRSSAVPMISNNILNVGVGGGNEAASLFSNCTYVTFVDIAHAGLERVKEQFPLSKVIVSSADQLLSISDNNYDLYVSLRTFNSSFFDIKKAISEAHRVLRPNAIIIVSVANGFLCSERHCIITGLIIPGTEFVDIYRGIDTAKLIHTELIQAGFNNIQVFPTNTEIYLSAVATK